MDLERGFLDDIIANPEDDTPRLVLADWLDDNGQEDRAEFIRIQVALARADTPDPLMLRRERDLLAFRGKEWAADFTGHVGQVLFRRGLVEGVAAGGELMEGFAARLRGWAGRHPIRLLRIDIGEGTGPLDGVTALVAKGLLRLEGLDVSMDGGPAAWLAKLARHAAGLRSLLLEHESSSGEWNRVLSRLATRPGALAGLTELGLAFGTGELPLEEATTEAFILSDAFPDLTRLHIPFAHFGAEALAYLGESPRWSKLTHLDLGCCHVLRAGWERLAVAPNTRRLKWLGLIAGHVEQEGGDWDSLRSHSLGEALRSLLGDAADFDTSSTFPRWEGVKP
jgi:uncharacterized protein (TIGR02996 family)